MNKLFKITAKKTKLAIGLLSGTSVDGIDAVLLKISGTDVNTAIKVIDFETYEIPENVKHAVIQNSNVSSARIDNICRLNIILARLFADAVLKICLKNKIKPEAVDFIGSHGQTIHHLPDIKKHYLGYR